MPQVRDGVKSTVKFGIDVVGTSLEVNDASRFPDPTLGQYWVTIWDATAKPNAVDDTTAETVRVTDKVANVLTIVRGEAGEIPIGHVANQAVRMLVDEKNTKCINNYDITAFGGDSIKDGATDAVAAMDAMLLAMAKTGHPGYFPKGSYRLATNVTWPTGISANKACTLLGDGRDESIIITRGVLSLKEPSLNLIVEKLQFRFGGGSDIRIMLDIGTGKMNAVFRDIKFEGLNGVVDSMLHIDDAFHVDFYSCVWRNYGGVGLWYDGLVNGGNFRFFSCNFEFIRTGIYVRNGATVNSIFFEGTKFIGSFSGDWTSVTDLTNAAGAWTLGTTSIFIGIDRDGLTPSSHAILLTNDNIEDLHTLSTYDKTTGVAVLRTGLKNNWTGESGAEIFVGSPGVIMGKRGRCLQLNNCHMEGTPIIVTNSYANTFENTTSSGCDENIAKTQGSNLAVAPATEPLNSFCFYITGSSRANVFINPAWQTDRADEKLCYAADAVGLADVPSGFIFIEPVRVDGSSAFSIEYPLKADSLSTTMQVIVGDEIRLGQGQSTAAATWGIRAGASGTAQTEIRQLRMFATYLQQVFVNDANYAFTAGTTADATLVVVTNLTAARTITLPAAQGGRRCFIMKATADAFAITVDRNGTNIMGVATDTTIASGVSHAMYTYTKVDGDTGWHESIES